jgi:hypothetical protein
MTEQGPPTDSYFGQVPTEVEIDGKVFWVNVHLAEVDGRFICVGLDLRSFYEQDLSTLGRASQPSETGDRLIDATIRALEAPPTPDKPKPVMVPTNDRFVEVTSPIVRGLRTSEVIEAAQAPIRDLLLRVTRRMATAPELALSPEQADKTREVTEQFWAAPERPRRGPRPQLDDAVLQDVVAATYRVTAKRPVQAVRVALEESRALRPPVTIDQARKAVAAARARGFLPPAKRSTGQHEDRS